MIKGKLAYLNRLYSRVPFKPVILKKDMEGSTPPSVFIGRHGYPRVYVGPLIPPEHGDTSIMDMPERWIQNKSQIDIINFRLQLVRGKQSVHVKEHNKTTEMLQEIALSKKSLDIEAHFSKIPQGRFLHEDVQPFGPSALLREIKVEAGKFDPHLEKPYYDTDLLSREAVIGLYEKGALVSAIQKAFSTGAFGLGRNRRLVPTRWSITAVDDMIGLHLLERVKTYETINEYRVYEYESLNNKFVILLLPTRWQYETMEAWFPQIIGDRLEIYSDFERFEKKKSYALIGGCYYSARLAIAEFLEKGKRQAGAILLRESYPGYIPLGVFNVRENVRAAMKTECKKFDTLNQALNCVDTLLEISLRQWISQSKLLKEIVLAAGAKEIFTNLRITNQLRRLRRKIVQNL